MKLFNREFWGISLTCIGVLLLVITIYKIFCPLSNQSKLQQVAGIFQSFFQSKPASSSKALQKGSVRTQPASPAKRSTKQLPSSLGKYLTKYTYRPTNIYNMWIWGIKPDRKTGNTIQIEMAHALAGDKGGFWIVAYIDTDNDNVPDKEIARSDYFTATTPGEWSSFTFKSSKKMIFIGHTWQDGDDVTIYRANGPWPLEESPLENYFYLSPSGSSRLVKHGPNYTNLRVTFSN